MDNKKVNQLLIAIQQGNKEALGELYDLTYIDIYKYIYSMTSNKEHAQDLTHDVFLQAYRHINSYDGKGHAMAWLITISRNQTYMFLRKQNKTVLLEQDIDHVDDQSDSYNNSILLDTIINDLDGEEKEIVVLHIIEDLTFIEISKILNMNLSTVLSKYHRSIKKLKKKYGGAKHDK